MINVGNNEQATGVSISGVTAVNVGGYGTLSGVALPVTLDNTGVTWSIASGNSIAIASASDNKCGYTGIREGQSVIRATSIKTPSVYSEITITVDSNITDDIYVAQGELKNASVNLTRTDGNTVTIDMSDELTWHEGN